MCCHGLWRQTLWVQILALIITSLLDCGQVQCVHPQRGIIIICHLIEQCPPYRKCYTSDSGCHFQETSWLAVVFMHWFLSLVEDPTALFLPSTKVWDTLTHHLLQLGQQHDSIFPGPTAQPTNTYWTLILCQALVLDFGDTKRRARCMPAWRSDCWEKSAETYADTEFLEDWSCHFLRTLEGQTEGRQGTEVSGKISLRRCQPNSVPGWASQGSRPLIVALYNWCFIYNWHFISLVHLMYHHISEHKIKIDWIDSATFYWDTVLRAFTRIMSFS